MDSVSLYNILVCSEYGLYYLGDALNKYLVINEQDVLGIIFVNTILTIIL